ncbi:MAG TPA: hypothetical protein VLX29_04685 [Nitrospirota bacterium]|nr:hypothetical protein [Nitrospirota bacterium]
MIILALLLPALLGFLLISLLLCNDRNAGLLERICLAFPLGAGMLTMQMFILGLLRIPLTLGYTLTPLALEIVLLSIWVLWKKVPLARPSRWDSGTGWNLSGTRKITMVILASWAGIKLLSIFIETGLRPIFAWDAWANWSAGAKLFYSMKSLLLDGPAQDFFTQGAVLRITSYPLHNPLMQVWLSMWTGGFDEVLSKFWSPVYLLALAGSLYVIAAKELNRLTALGLLVMFLSSPLLSYHSVEVYSDMPLSVYLFLASASFLYVMRGRRSYLPLIALFSAEALFTKDESLFFVAPLLISAAVWVLRSPQERPRKWRTLTYMFAPLLLIAPWYAFKFYHALGLGAEFIKVELVFHPEIIGSVTAQILFLPNFNLFFTLFPILFVLGGKPNNEFFHLFVIVACYALFFIMLYMFTSFYNAHFTNDDVFCRNLLTYYPVVVLLTVLQLKKQLPLFWTARIPKPASARKK